MKRMITRTLAVVAIAALFLGGAPAQAKPHPHKTRHSHTVCPAGTLMLNGVCVPAQGSTWYVICPAGTQMVDEVCVKP